MLTRRQMLATTSTFAGYAIAVDKVLAQAIKTDTEGIIAGDQVVKIGDYEMPVYEARPATGKDHAIVLVIPRSGAFTRTSAAAPAVSPRPATMRSRRSCSSARAASRRSRTSRTS